MGPRAGRRGRARRGGASQAAPRLRPRLPPVGRGHRGRLGAWLHAEPDQPDPRRPARAAQGHRLQLLGRPPPALRRHAPGCVRPSAAPGALCQVAERHLGAGWGQLPQPQVPHSSPHPTLHVSVPNEAREQDSSAHAHVWPGEVKGTESSPLLPTPASASSQGLALLLLFLGVGIQTPRSPQPVNAGLGLQGMES